MIRYRVLIASVIMQMCLGATYSWSAYVKPLRQITGLLQGPVQLPFTVFYFIFPATVILSGSLISRLGPHRCAMLGGILFGGGWLLAGLGHLHFFFTIMGIGVLAGMGAGFAYIVPIATCVKWFPRQAGLVTGIAVAGFGGGAALVTQVAGFLMADRLLTPFDTFAALGVLFALLVTVAGSCMRDPKGTVRTRRPPLPIAHLMGNRHFRVLYLAMFAGLAAGFAVNANLKELFPGAGLEAGLRAVSLFAIANAAGRIGWGWVFDRWGGNRIIVINLLLQALLLFSGPLLLTSDNGLLGFAVAAGFNYGGVLVLYAATVACRWGQESVGQVYGWLFSANIPAALAPLLAGLIFDRTGSFTIPMMLIGAALGSAGVLMYQRGQKHNPCSNEKSQITQSVSKRLSGSQRISALSRHRKTND